MTGFEAGFLLSLVTVGPVSMWLGYLIGCHLSRRPDPLPPLDQSHKRYAAQIRGRIG